MMIWCQKQRNVHSKVVECLILAFLSWISFCYIISTKSHILFSLTSHSKYKYKNGPFEFIENPRIFSHLKLLSFNQKLLLSRKYSLIVVHMLQKFSALLFSRHYNQPRRQKLKLVAINRWKIELWMAFYVQKLWDMILIFILQVMWI